MHFDDGPEEKWWNSWYGSGHSSGPGSEGKLLEYKVNYLNKLFKEHNIKTVLDFGCGDGVVASKLNCQFYLGVDISDQAIKLCKARINRQGFSFERRHFFDHTPMVIKNKFASSLDCCMCIDVLYHISDVRVLNKTLETLFTLRARIIVLYTFLEYAEFSEDMMEYLKPSACLYCRNFSDVLANLSKSYKLIDKVKPKSGTEAGFLVYEKIKEVRDE